MTCSHTWTVSQYLVDEHGNDYEYKRWCSPTGCGESLGLGPAMDAGVAVEIRAAEIIQDEEEGEKAELSWNELAGWVSDEAHAHRDGFFSGWLARAYFNHDGGTP